jgi:hypothetical protein
LSDLNAELYLIFGIFLGIFASMMMPFLQKVMNDELTWNDFDMNYAAKAVATLIWSAIAAVFVFFAYPGLQETDPFRIVLIGLVYGFTAFKATNGFPDWAQHIYDLLFKRSPPSNPGTASDSEQVCEDGHNCPASGDDPKTGVEGFLSRFSNWFFEKRHNGNKAEATLELVVFTPIQYYFMTALWKLARATTTENWAVADRVFWHILGIGGLSIAILWGRDLRSWFKYKIQLWLDAKTAYDMKMAEARSKLAMAGDVIEQLQAAAHMVLHGKQILLEMDDAIHEVVENAEIPQTPG